MQIRQKNNKQKSFLVNTEKGLRMKQKKQVGWTWEGKNSIGSIGALMSISGLQCVKCTVFILNVLFHPY